MIEGLLIGFLVIVGLGNLFPKVNFSFGFILFNGSVLLPLILFVLTAFVGFPVFWSGVLIIGISIVNLFRLLIFYSHRLNGYSLYLFFHPGILLPISILLIGLFTDYSSYLLWNWDEFSSWGSWAKQSFVTDAYWHKDMFYIGTPQYPKGWPITIAFSQVPFSLYDEFRGIALLTLFHIAVLALTFDVLRLIIEKEAEAPKKISFLLSWLIILLLITAECSWKLLPPSLLIERPVLYWTIGLFILTLMALYQRDSPNKIFICIGTVLASGVVLKTPTLILVIPAGLICLLYWKREYFNLNFRVTRFTLFRLIIYVFAPPLIIISIWSLHSHSESPSVELPKLLGIFSQDEFYTLSNQIKIASIEYLSSYKPFLTIVGIFGFVSVLWYPRQRILLLAVPVFFIVSWMTLWPLYLFNMSNADMIHSWPNLSSFQRYVRLPIRIIHYIGPALLAINMFSKMKSNDITWLRVIMREKYLVPFLFISTVILGTFQVYSVNNIYHDMGHRLYGSTTNDPLRASRLKSFRAQAKTLNALIKNHDLSTPRVLFISQGNTGFARVMANYYSMHNKRGGKLQKYKLQDGWSWGPRKTNVFVRVTSEGQFKNLIIKSKIVWPHQLDIWSKNILSNFIKNTNCKQNIVKFFLININDILLCYPKNVN